MKRKWMKTPSLSIFESAICYRCSQRLKKLTDIHHCDIYRSSIEQGKDYYILQCHYKNDKEEQKTKWCKLSAFAHHSIWDRAIKKGG